MNTYLTNVWRFVKKSPAEFTLIAIMLGVLLYAALPVDAFAQKDGHFETAGKTLQMEIQAMQNSVLPYGTLPDAKLRPPTQYMRVAVTAYNSVPWQTDTTPCISADGTNICKTLEAGSNTCAANFLPLGTVIEVDGLGTCVVRDRMNARYWHRVDWYMGQDVSNAKRFGVQYKQIGIYPST